MAWLRAEDAKRATDNHYAVLANRIERSDYRALRDGGTGEGQP